MQLWATNSVGGFLASTKLSKYLAFRAQPIARFRNFTEMKIAKGKEGGDTFNWNKIANVTDFGGKLIETDTVHKTEQTISRGTLTITEYANSIPFTKKLETLSEFQLKEMIRKGLLDDFRKCMDGDVERQFNGCQLRYVGTTSTAGTLTTDGTATATNSSALNKYHLKNMIDELMKRNVPTWDGGHYICIASVEAVRGMIDDLESIKAYTDIKDIYDGEVGRFYNCRILLDNYATRFTYDSTARTSTAKSWTNGLSLDSYAFGAGTVAEAVALPESIIAKEVTDYGRSKGLAWYWLGGYALEWDDEPNARIIKFDSAA